MLAQYFRKVVLEYENYRKNYRNKKNNKRYIELIELVRNEIPLELNRLDFLKDLEIKSNNIMGMPNVPLLPMISIRDKRISSGFSDGIYIVIFIKPNYGVCISLNQGTENISIKGINIFRNTVIKEIKACQEYKSLKKLGAVNEINLTKCIEGENINKNRPRKYEAGNIIGMDYSVEELLNKHIDDKITEDLYFFIKLYKQIVLQNINKKNNNKMKLQKENKIYDLRLEMNYLEKDEATFEAYEYTAIEGEKRFFSHQKRERDPKIIKLAKRRFKMKNGKLFCEVCLFSFKDIYGDLGKDFIEGHHNIPLNEYRENDVTNISDIIMVCPNCHRMLHRNNISVDELRLAIKSTYRTLNS